MVVKLDKLLGSWVIGASDCSGTTGALGTKLSTVPALFDKGLNIRNFSFTISQIKVPK